MNDADRRTALLVIAREAEPVVREWRLRYLRESVERGIPPHLTILFPFVPEPEIGDEILTALERLYALVPPFDYASSPSSRFPTRRGSRPRPPGVPSSTSSPGRAAFPDRPPYGNPEHVPVPHCTIGADDDPASVEAMVREAALRARPGSRSAATRWRSPSSASARDGSWFERGAFPLEGRR